MKEPVLSADGSRPKERAPPQHSCDDTSGEGEQREVEHMEVSEEEGR